MAWAPMRQILRPVQIIFCQRRPEWHPVIVHLSSLAQADDWSCRLPDSFFVLARQFWPGPLTMIVSRSKKVLDQVTGGQETVGLRMPDHPIALALLREFGQGVAAPSANKFGRLSPTTAADVEEDFGPEIAMVLDGGPCQVGIESTIVDLSLENPRILRPGMISAEAVAAAIGSLEEAPLGSNMDVRAPGTIPIHYAPQTPLRMVPSHLLQSAIEKFQDKDAVAVISFNQPQSNGSPPQDWIVADRHPLTYARSMYANLRRLDQLNKRLIIVEEPPNSAEWIGIWDRLTRASANTARLD